MKLALQLIVLTAGVGGAIATIDLMNRASAWFAAAVQLGQ